MTDKLRQRARELAEQAWDVGGNAAYTQFIIVMTDIVITGMREALREEPDNGMVDATSQGLTTAREIFSSMAEARARGLE